LGAVACVYLSWVREKNAQLAAAVFTTISSIMLPNWVLSNSAPLVRYSLLAIGLSMLATSPRAEEFILYLLSLPGLFYQVIPMYMSTDFSWFTKRLMSMQIFRWLGSRMQQPQFNDRMPWDSSEVIMDRNNKWDLVSVAGQSGEGAWNSQGIEINLHWNQLNDPLLAPALQFTSQDAIDAKDRDAHPSSQAGTATTASSPLASLVERICNGASGAGALHGMDSMQAIQLAEGVRREFGKPVTVADVLRCGDIDELLEVIKQTEEEVPEQAAQVSQRDRRDGIRRIWLCGMGPRSCTVDWLVCQQDRKQHLNIPAFHKAVDRLVVRHGALRARNFDEQPMFLATYNAASLWQLRCSSGKTWTRSKLGHWAGESIFQAWPRSKLLPPNSEASHVEVLRPTVCGERCGVTGLVAWK
jgi:hypothetical protein